MVITIIIIALIVVIRIRSLYIAQAHWQTLVTTTTAGVIVASRTS
jgi:hypothetical protein